MLHGSRKYRSNVSRHLQRSTEALGYFETLIPKPPKNLHLVDEEQSAGLGYLPVEGNQNVAPKRTGLPS